MTQLVLDDDLLDAQTLRAAGAALYGGADLGECIVTARRVRGVELDSWHDEWRATADTVGALADEAEARGARETARLAHLRASTYYRTAGLMLMGVPLDPRLVETNALQTERFRRAGALMALPPEILEIPFEEGTLRGTSSARPTTGGPGRR